MDPRDVDILLIVPCGLQEQLLFTLSTRFPDRSREPGYQRVQVSWISKLPSLMNNSVDLHAHTKMKFSSSVVVLIVAVSLSVININATKMNQERRITIKSKLDSVEPGKNITFICCYGDDTSGLTAEVSAILPKIKKEIFQSDLNDHGIFCGHLYGSDNCRECWLIAKTEYDNLEMKCSLTLNHSEVIAKNSARITIAKPSDQGITQKAVGENETALPSDTTWVVAVSVSLSVVVVFGMMVTAGIMLLVCACIGVKRRQHPNHVDEQNNLEQEGFTLDDEVETDSPRSSDPSGQSWTKLIHRKVNLQD